MNPDQLNALPEEEARAEFLRCCGATRWADAMVNTRPFASEKDLFDASERAANELRRDDWLEAFSHHPRIGDIDSLREKFAATRTWSEGEQSGAAGASEETLHALARENDAYFDRFGFIFIVSATGKTAEEMLTILRGRLPNDLERELQIAADEQRKITRIRLEKLLS